MGGCDDVVVCCIYRCSMVDSLSMMTWTGRWWWSWAMSLMVDRTVISAGVRVDVGGVVRGRSEAMMSKEIRKLVDPVVIRGSRAVCLKKAVRGQGIMCHLSSFV